MTTVDADVLVKVEVTAEDIQRGKRKLCRECPVARALTRAAGKQVEVGNSHYRDEAAQWHRPLPEVAKHFIAAFDYGGSVAPFTFDVGFPESFLSK